MTPTILLVDDNEDMLEFLTEELQDTYHLFQASSGEDALSIFAEESIHLIITDIMMPGIDGFQLCRTIKTNFISSHIPIILLTARNTLQSKIEGLEIGADAYIEKPFEMAYLRVQVANLLQNRSRLKAYFATSPIAQISSIAHSSSDEAFLSKLSNWIVSHLEDPDLDVGQLAASLNMSKPTLYRKIKGISDLTPHELITVTRLKKAAELLTNSQMKIYEISYMVGFQSQAHFGKSFLKQFGMTPTEYANSNQTRH